MAHRTKYRQLTCNRITLRPLSHEKDARVALISTIRCQCFQPLTKGVHNDQPTSRSQIKVLYCCPFRQVQSSMPLTRRLLLEASAVSWTLRRKVSLMTGSRSRAASACAGRPPSARPRYRTTPCRREVRRACGRGTSGGNCSASILAGQRRARQRKQ